MNYLERIKFAVVLFLVSFGSWCATVILLTQMGAV